MGANPSGGTNFCYCGYYEVEMKIIDRRTECNHVGISRLNLGDTFMWGGNAFIKTNGGAVALFTGVTYIDEDFRSEYAILFEATLTIERNK